MNGDGGVALTDSNNRVPDLTGRVALVTGGSRGLGAAIVCKLRAAGCDVLVNYRADDTAAARVLADTQSLPGSAVAVRGDVAVPADLHAVLDEAERRYGRLDVYIHNAAILRPMDAANADPEAVQATLALALNPLLYAAPRLITLMPAGGRIVAISSNGARGVISQYVATGVAKAALESLVRYLAVEFAPRGVTVNTVSTAMLDKGEPLGEGPRAQVVAMLAARTPAGRLSRPDDVAEMVTLLCAPGAAWVHGQTVTVDGGLGLRT